MPVAPYLGSQGVSADARWFALGGAPPRRAGDSPDSRSAVAITGDRLVCARQLAARLRSRHAWPRSRSRAGDRHRGGRRRRRAQSSPLREGLQPSRRAIACAATCAPRARLSRRGDAARRRTALAAADSARRRRARRRSPTNVQEAGVDEPDIVKASGSTIFALAGDRLRAVDVSGDVPAVARLDRAPRRPRRYAYADDRQLLLSGDRALVISARPTAVPSTATCAYGGRLPRPC